MRRATTWIPILALVLLAVCALWILPRNLRERGSDPGRGAGGSDQAVAQPEPETLSEGSAKGPPNPDSGALVAERSDAADDARGPSSTREPDDAADHPPAPSSLAGRVVDRTGRPVPGATVLAARAPELGAFIVRTDWWITHLPLDVADPVALGAEVPVRTVSDAAGRFLIEDLAPGRVRLAARSGRLAPLDRNDIRLAAGERRALGDLLLEPAAQIYGVLEDGAGRGVSGAPIVEVDEFTDAALPALAFEAGLRLAMTDLRGAFQSRPLIVGTWAARAFGGTTLVDAPMRGGSPADGWNLRETMNEAGSIVGVLSTHGPVVDDLLVRAVPADTARSPVPFACRGDGRSGRVLPNGAFEIDGLAPLVLYELRAGAANQPFDDESLWSPPVFAASSDEEVRVPWEPDASVSFALVDATARASVSSCEVELLGALPALPLHAAPGPDRDGSRTLAGIRPRRSFTSAGLHVASRGFRPLVQRLDLRPARVASLGTLSMSPLPVLEIRVVDAVTGAPIRGALVSAADAVTGRDPSDLETAPVSTDASGTARIAAFVGADSQIEVRARGHARQRRLGPFGGGFSTPRLEFRLTRGATARIHVVDAGGGAIPGARVEWVEGNWSPNDARSRRDTCRALDRSDPETSRIADGDGLVVFHHLTPGRHAFHVERHAEILDGEWTQRELAEGEETDIQLQSTIRGSLEIRITDAGTPLAGIPLVLLRRSSVASLLDVAELENPLPPGIDARTDSSGARAFADLDPGAYVLAFAVPGQRSRGCREVLVREGPSVIAFDLAKSALSGRVGKGERHPVPGARILLADPTRDRELREAIRRRGSLSPTGAPAGAEAATFGLDHEATVADANGEFRLLGLPIGAPIVVVAIEDPCGYGKSEPLVLREDFGTTNAEVVVRPAGALEIRAASWPLAAPILLYAVPDDRRLSPRIRKILPGSSVILSGLEPGPWELQFGDANARAKDRQRVDVVAGETSTVEWSLP